MGDNQIKILERLDIENLNLILEQGEKQLDDIEGSYHSVLSKSTSMFQLFVVILTGVISYIISSDFKESITTLRYQTALITMILLCIIVYQLYKAVRPIIFSQKGTKPSSIVHPYTYWYVDDKDANEKNKRRAIISIIRSVNTRIETNNKEQNKIALELIKSFRYITLSAVAISSFILGFLLFNILFL